MCNGSASATPMSKHPITDALIDSIVVREGGYESIPLEKAGEIELLARRLEIERFELAWALRALLDCGDEHAKNSARALLAKIDA
jgi:hypothetical protein